MGVESKAFAQDRKFGKLSSLVISVKEKEIDYDILVFVIT